MGLGVDGDVPAVVSPDGTHGLFPLAAGRATTRPSSFHPRATGGVGGGGSVVRARPWSNETIADGRQSASVSSPGAALELTCRKERHHDYADHTVQAPSRHLEKV